jgi:hypothetical protein
MEISEAYKQILESEQEMLEEGIVKNAIVGAAIAGAGLLALHSGKEQPVNPVSVSGKVGNVNPERDMLVSKVLSKYKIGEQKAHQIVGAAMKHADPVFPKAHDILAVIGKESTFNEKAVSNVGAKGLMQVRPKIWNLGHGELDTIDGQVKHGVAILKAYHKKFGTVDSTLHSYNIGETNFRNKKNLNPKYVENFHKERELYN